MILAFVLLLLAAAPTSAAEPPETTITVSSIGAIEAHFTLSSSVPGSTFEYRVDASPWSSTGADLRLQYYSSASHVLEARATDPSGQVDPTPANYAFSISGVPFRPNEEFDPPRLTKFTAKGRLLKFTASDDGTVEFTIDQCGWRGFTRSCREFATATKKVDDGRFTLVLSKHFHRGKKYRVSALATSDTGPSETTKRTVTAK